MAVRKNKPRKANDITLTFHDSREPGFLRITDTVTGTETLFPMSEAMTLALRILEAGRADGFELRPVQTR